MTTNVAQFPREALGSTSGMRDWRRLAVEYNAWILIVLLAAVGTAVTPIFFTVSNLTNILEQSSIIGVLALGQFLVILTGGIDLSVGSMMALTAMVGAMAMPTGSPIAVVAAVAVGGVLGMISGLVVVRGKLPAFITTFGMMAIARGLALTAHDGGAVNISMTSGFAQIGKGTFPIAIWAVAVLIVYVFLRRMRTGAYIYAVGGNVEATRVSGVNSGGVIVLVYAISGVCAAVTGLIFLARSGVALPTYGNGYDLQTIAAVIVGGANIMGGEGKLSGAVIGVIFMTMLSNILDLVGANPFWSFCVIGAVLWLAVMLRSSLDRARLDRG